MVKPVIFQVAGYQNSGKTTLTSKLIDALTTLGLKTVTIKHHGHGGKPSMMMQKDSEKHLSAGAVASIVEGEGRLILQADSANKFTLGDQIELLTFFEPDVILIEGYKQENYPKILLVRNQDDLELLDSVKNVWAFVSWKEELLDYLKVHCNLPSFFIGDEIVLKWTCDVIQSHVHKIEEKS